MRKLKPSPRHFVPAPVQPMPRRCPGGESVVVHQRVDARFHGVHVYLRFRATILQVVLGSYDGSGELALLAHGNE